MNPPAPQPKPRSAHGKVQLSAGYRDHDGAYRDPITGKVVSWTAYLRELNTAADAALRKPSRATRSR